MSRARRGERRERVSDRRKVPQRNIIGCGSFVWQRRQTIVGTSVNTRKMKMMSKKKKKKRASIDFVFSLNFYCNPNK